MKKYRGEIAHRINNAHLEERIRELEESGERIHQANVALVVRNTELNERIAKAREILKDVVVKSGWVNRVVVESGWVNREIEAALAALEGK